MSSINDVVDSVLVEVSDAYKLELNENESILIRVKKFNKEYFLNSSDVVLHSMLYLTDYKKYCKFKNRKVNMFNFLRNSVRNDYYLENNLIFCNFEVVTSKVIMENKHEFDILGEFYSGGYKFVLVSGFQIFIQDTVNNCNTQYLYYGN